MQISKKIFQKVNRWLLVNRRPLWKFVLVVMLLLLLRFYPLLLGKTLFFGDNYSLMVPGKLFTASWLRQGILPLWNPYILGGVPWIGDINQSVLYPSTLLFMVFHPATALNLTIVSHLLLSMIGAYLFIYTLRRDHDLALLACVLWGFSTQLTNSINNISILQSLTWLPWLAWLGLRVAGVGRASNARTTTERTANKRTTVEWFNIFFRRTFKFKFFYAIVVWLQFAGGYPQHVLYGISTSVVLALFYYFYGQEKNRLKKNWLQLKDFFLPWALTALLVLGLTAVLYLPFLEVLANSTRSQQTVTQALSGSLHPVELIKLLLPYFFNSAHDGMRWGPAWNTFPNVVLYATWFGWLLLGLALMNYGYQCWQCRQQQQTSQSLVGKKQARHEFFFLAAWSLLTLVLACGKYLPFYQSFISKLPLSSVVRNPSLILTITSFLLIVLLTQVVKKIKLTGRGFKTILFLSSAVLAVAGLVVYLANFQMDFVWQFLNQITGDFFSRSLFHTPARDQIILTVISRNLAINAAFLIVALYIWQQKKFAVLALVLGLDSIFNTQGMLLFAPKDVYPSWQQIEQAEQQSLVTSLRGLEKSPLEQNALIASNAQTAQYRYLIRNYNFPYTDFGAYWEALLVRQPFSDSYITSTDMQDYHHLKRFAQGFTPDWNMVYGVPAINGYTTLMPADFVEVWGAGVKLIETESVEPQSAEAKQVVPYDHQPNELARINNLRQIVPQQPSDKQLLDAWAVNYYLVDDWFFVDEDLSAWPVVREWLGGRQEDGGRQDSRWQVYELGALPRFRWEDGQANAWGNRNSETEDNQKEIMLLEETPNALILQINNPVDSRSTSNNQLADNRANTNNLIIADRYDRNWRAWVDGEEVEIENWQGIRFLDLVENETKIVPEAKVVLKYWPGWFYFGVGISLVTLGVGVFIFIKFYVVS